MGNTSEDPLFVDLHMFKNWILYLIIDYLIVIIYLWNRNNNNSNKNGHRFVSRIIWRKFNHQPKSVYSCRTNGSVTLGMMEKDNQEYKDDPFMGGYEH